MGGRLDVVLTRPSKRIVGHRADVGDQSPQGDGGVSLANRSSGRRAASPAEPGGVHGTLAPPRDTVNRGVGAERARFPAGGTVAYAGAPLMAERAAPPNEVLRSRQDVGGNELAVASGAPLAGDLGEELRERVGDGQTAASAERTARPPDADVHAGPPGVVARGGTAPPDRSRESERNVRGRELAILASIPFGGQL